MITSNTKINLGIAATIVTTGISVAWMVRGAVSDTNARVQALERELTSLRETGNALSTQLTTVSSKLTTMADDYYPLSRASEQALRQAIENPGMRVPDPRDPTRVIVVDGVEPKRGQVR